MDGLLAGSVLLNRASHFLLKAHPPTAPSGCHVLAPRQHGVASQTHHRPQPQSSSALSHFRYHLKTAHP
ncbi:hypothetical protein VTI74DRAFT_3732 [Chaetomium olivicolor]